MAELFAKQGHAGRAASIYRKVIREHPQDERAKQRLRELETLAASEQGGPMSFREHIQRIVDSTPGAVACTIMGFDGIAIDTYDVGAAELDVPNLLIEYASSAQVLRRNANSETPGGALVEMTVCGGKLSALLRPLTEEYFLGVVLRPNGLMGKARFLMRLAAGDIIKELA